MSRFTPEVEKRLREAGWYPGRDISEHFCFGLYSRLFPASIAAYREFGYLTLYRDEEDEKEGIASLLLDVDNSEHSRKMRRKAWGLPENGGFKYPVRRPVITGLTTADETKEEGFQQALQLALQQRFGEMHSEEPPLIQNEVELACFDELLNAERYLAVPCARLGSFTNITDVHERFLDWDRDMTLYLSLDGAVYAVGGAPHWIAPSFDAFLGIILSPAMRAEDYDTAKRD